MASEVFAVLGEPVRRGCLICCWSGRGRGELVELLGLSRWTSKHLRVLRSGLVRVRVDAQRRCMS